MDRQNRILQMLLSVVAIVSFTFSAIICFWADSEIWPMKISSFIGDPETPYNFWIKPAYMVFLNPIYHLSQFLPFSHMDAGRIVFLIGGLLSLWLGTRILSQQGVNKTFQFLYFLLILTSWIYLERGFRIRSDNLLTVFFLLLLSLVLSHLKSHHFRSKQLTVFLVSLFSLMLITPKFVVVLICFFPLWVHYFKRFSANVRNQAINIFFGLVAVFIALTVFHDGLRQALLQQFFYLEDSFFNERGEFDFFAFYRFEHPIRFVLENPVIVIGILFKLFWVIRNFNHWWQQKDVRVLDISCALLLVAFIFYPNRMPFLISSYVPILFLGVFTGLNRWDNRIKESHIIQSVVVWLAVVLVASSGYKTWTTFQSHSNREQRELYFDLKLLAEDDPFLVIFDPVGISPSSRAQHFYLGPSSREGNLAAADMLTRRPPDLILWGQRLAWLEDLLPKKFWFQYRQLSRSGVYQKGELIVPINNKSSSSVKGMFKIPTDEMLRPALSSLDLASDLDIIPLSVNWKVVPGFLLEYSGQMVRPVQSQSVEFQLVRDSKFVHFKGEVDKISVFSAKGTLLTRYNMRKLLRFDPEF